MLFGAFNFDSDKDKDPDGEGRDETAGMVDAEFLKFAIVVVVSISMMAGARNIVINTKIVKDR